MPVQFPFGGPRDLLSKARRELNQLLKAVEPEDGKPNELLIGDLTMNVAWTLWHVTDWIGNNNDPAVAKIVASKGITATGRARTERLQNQLISESPDLRHCWELATKFKHFELDERSRDDAELEGNYLSAPAGFLAAAPNGNWFISAARDNDQASRAAVHYSGGVMVAGSLAVSEREGRKTLHPKIQHDGERIRLTDVYGRAYDYLDRLLKESAL